MRLLLAAYFAFCIVTIVCAPAAAQPGRPLDASWRGYASHKPDALPYFVLNKDNYYLIQLHAPLKRQQLQQQGFQLLRQLDERHYIVALAESSTVPASQGRYQLYVANRQWKLSQRLAHLIQEVQPQQEHVFVLKGTRLAALKSRLAAYGDQLRVLEAHEASQTLVLRCSASLLTEQLLPLQEVLFADVRLGTPREESRLLDANLSVNGISYLHHAYPTLRGQGMLVSIKEQRYKPDDLDLLGRHVPNERESASFSGHATDMATIIAGAATTESKSQGVAPQAQITSSSFLQQLPDPEAYFRSNGILLQNHSYGTQPEHYYGAEAAAYDASTLQLPEVLHVFSSGNSGRLTPEAGTYKGIAGVANLTGNVKQAKNVLVVGALDTLKQPDPYVSQGPAYDGRIKPELVAYSSTGSSASAALVSGTATLLQQAYLQKWNNTAPPASLIKTILINTADDIGSTGPDFTSGYGSLQAYRALEDLLAKRYFTGEVGQDGLKTFLLQVPEGAQSLTLSLLWPDVPAEPNSAKALVNDLDFQLLHEGSGEVWLPWVLNTYPHPDSLSKPATRGADHLNPVEQISLKNPKAGTYILQIKGYDVPQGPQPFYLAYTWEEADAFRWTYPTASDNLPLHGEKSGIIRWESSWGAEAKGLLEWSADGGTSWQLVAQEVDLSKEFYQWQLPRESGLARLRMTVAGNRYESGVFTLARTFRPAVGFNCTDSVMVYWKPTSGAVAYTLYGLGERQLAPIATTTDTLLVLQKQEYPYQYLAVAPQFAQGQEGIRSPTFDYQLQGVACYISNFMASLRDTGVWLRLQLGTTRQVEEIIFERKAGEEGPYVAFASISPEAGGAFTEEVIDTEAPEGYIDYRARLVFSNGTAEYTHEERVFVMQESLALVFPNPVLSQGELKVYLKKIKQNLVLFTLLNARGQPIFRHELLAEREIVELPFLPPGIYLYTLKGEGLSKSGKLVVQ